MFHKFQESQFTEDGVALLMVRTNDRPADGRMDETPGPGSYLRVNFTLHLTFLNL